MPISLNSLLTAGPGLDQPVEMLAACHDRIEAQCGTLERLADHVAAAGADTAAQEAASAVMRYFDTAGENHHQDEELDLFPALRVQAGTRSLEVEALLAALLIEHGRMRSAWRDQLRPQLAAVAEGTAALTATVVKHFTTLYRQHIAREDRELLPLAAAVLDAEQLRTLSQRMSERRGVKG